eukprot:986080-Rhodomonas_salina.2
MVDPRTDTDTGISSHKHVVWVWSCAWSMRTSRPNLSGLGFIVHLSHFRADGSASADVVCRVADLLCRSVCGVGTAGASLVRSRFPLCPQVAGPVLPKTSALE